ncbi:MAG: hypothetical protein PHU63_04780 [Candidatus ainarchaeum sp.]|nr:hypothetical protein [Candidatus ainarchaeum sp.]
MKCIRCGQEAAQYGTDGMPYCHSCLFYGMNKQCMKCGMYLPALELQMYRGQWYCPYCVMDLREEHEPKYEKGKGRHEQTLKQDHCERCGKTIHDFFYIHNGRKLCKTCLDEEKGEPGLGSPSPMKFSVRRKEEPFYTPLIVPAKSFAEGFIHWILVKLKLKKLREKTEIVALEKKESEKEKKKENWSEHKKD